MMDIFTKMLKENTGIAMCDSGGANGRAWQRNQTVNFAKQPEATVDFKYGVEVTVSVYHFLKNRLTLDVAMDRKFRNFARREDNKNKYWLELAKDFASSLDARGLYGEGSPMTVNTYNGEDLLSQTIQYTLFTTGGSKRYDRTTYVALQIHGGADARGGYTSARIFKVDDDEGVSLFDNARATIYCSGDHQECGMFWDTDNGCEWRREDSRESYHKLENLERTTEAAGQVWEQGKLHVDNNRNGYCPHCGAKLEASGHPAG